MVFAKGARLINCVEVVPRISNPALQNAEMDKNKALKQPSEKPYAEIIDGSKHKKPINSTTKTKIKILLISLTTPCVSSLFKLSWRVILSL